MMKKTKLILTLIFALQLSVVNAQWEYKTRLDEMTNEAIVHFANSAKVLPTKEMRSSYADTKSMLVFSCTDEFELLQVWVFGRLPLLEVDTLENGDEVMTTRIRIDDEVSQVNIVKSTEHYIFYFEKSGSLIADLVLASSVKLELNELNGLNVYFDYDLKDAAKMIQKARSGCKEMQE